VAGVGIHTDPMIALTHSTIAIGVHPSGLTNAIVGGVALAVNAVPAGRYVAQQAGPLFMAETLVWLGAHPMPASAIANGCVTLNPHPPHFTRAVMGGVAQSVNTIAT